jgi:tetratricopeptide (TPR) repeat protein
MALAIASVSVAAAQNADALHLQARELLRRNDLAAALPLFERCVAAEPADSRHRQWLGRARGLQTARKGIAAGMGGVNKVKAEFEKAIELDPNNLEARHDLAVLYRVVPRMFGGSDTKAAEQVAIIRQKDPALATQIEADFLARAKKPREAIALHEQAIRLNPTRPRPHVSIAILSQGLKDWSRSIPDIRSRCISWGEPRRSAARSWSGASRRFAPTSHCRFGLSSNIRRSPLLVIISARFWRKRAIAMLRVWNTKRRYESIRRTRTPAPPLRI